MVDVATGKVINVILLLVCKDQALANILNIYDVYQSGTSCASQGFILVLIANAIETEEEIGFLGRVTKYPVYAVESLVMRLLQLRANVYNTPNIKALLDFLEEEYPRMVKKIEEFLRDGKVTYDGNSLRATFRSVSLFTLIITIRIVVYL